MRLLSTILLCMAVAVAGPGCKAQQGACASMGVGDLLMRAAIVRLDVYSGSIGCDGDTIAAGAPAPSQTSVVKEGEAIKLDVPAGRHVLVVSAFSDSAATQLLGSACSVVTLKANTPACFNLTLAPPVDLATSGGDDAAPTCTQSPDDCPVGSWCGPDNHCAAGCRTNADCAATPTSPLCLVADHRCVACLAGSDCPTGQRCSPSGACVTGCDTQAGSECDVSLMCCDQLCLDTTSDVDNCGGCARACVAAGTANVAAAKCSGSVCKPTCAAGFADCSEPAAPAADDGCETNIHTVAHCGTCGNACSLTQATAACATGTCTIASCNSGFVDCNAKAADGCECAKLADANGGCCPANGSNPGGCEYTHTTGFGQSFIDCATLGTYNSTIAQEAAKAFSSTGTLTVGANCSDGTNIIEQIVCVQTATQCACFTYAESDGGSTYVGKARLTTATGDMGAPACSCVTPTSGSVNWR